jgi:hypothetical protein
MVNLRVPQVSPMQETTKVLGYLECVPGSSNESVLVIAMGSESVISVL